MTSMLEYLDSYLSPRVSAATARPAVASPPQARAAGRASSRKTYSGFPGGTVWVTEPERRYLLPHRGLRSLDGFSWGFNGAGPSDLALSLLVDAIGPELAAEHFLEFKSQVVAQLPERGSWALSEVSVRSWMAFHLPGEVDA